MSRDLAVRAALNVRNELLVAALYYPFLFMLMRWPVYLLKVLAGGLFPRGAALRGALQAIRLYPAIWRKRDPVAVGPFLRWKRLPKPVKLV